MSSNFIFAVIEAKFVPVTDMNGFSDPYVKIKYGKQKAKTEVIKKCLNPVWMQCFTLHTEAPETEIELQVYDEDPLIRDDFIGAVQIPRKDIEEGRRNIIDCWYHVVSKSKQETKTQLRVVISSVGSKIDLAAKYASFKAPLTLDSIDTRPWSIPLPNPPADNFSGLREELLANEALTAALISTQKTPEESRSLAMLLFSEVPKHRDQITSVFRAAFQKAMVAGGASNAFKRGPILQCASWFAFFCYSKSIHEKLPIFYDNMSNYKDAENSITSPTTAFDLASSLILLKYSHLISSPSQRPTVPLDVIRLVEIPSSLQANLSKEEMVRFVSGTLLDTIIAHPLETGFHRPRFGFSAPAQRALDTALKALHERDHEPDEPVSKYLNLDTAKERFAFKEEVDEYPQFDADTITWASFKVLNVLSASQETIPEASKLVKQYMQN